MTTTHMTTTQIESAVTKPKKKKHQKRLTFSKKKRGNQVPHASTKWTDDIPEAITFRPTAEEFQDPFKYIASIAEEASQYGICKIVPPVKMAVAAGVVLKHKHFEFTTNVQNVGVYRTSGSTFRQNKFFRSGKRYTLSSFQEMANEAMTRKFGCCGSLPSEIVEKEFWKEMLRVPNNKTVEYGSDIDGSAFTEAMQAQCPLGSSMWNLKNFARAGLSSLKHLKEGIPGVSDPMLYCGMLFSVFAWHVEDSYLNSINFHHLGAPKLWYGVPSSEADAFDRVACEHVFNQSLEECDGEQSQAKLDKAAHMFMKKTVMFSPKVLLDNDVTVYKIFQQPGEFVITFPRAYHGGFSTGFNLGEAVNFATQDWFEHGIHAQAVYHRLRKTPIVSVEELACKEFLCAQEHEGRTQEAKGKGGVMTTMPEGQGRAGGASKSARDEDLTGSLSSVVRSSLASIVEFTKGFEGACGLIQPQCSHSSMACSECSALCYLQMVMTEEGDFLCLKCAEKTSCKKDIGMKLFLHPHLFDMANHLASKLPSKSADAKELRALMGCDALAGFKQRDAIQRNILPASPMKVAHEMLTTLNDKLKKPFSFSSYIRSIRKEQGQGQGQEPARSSQTQTHERGTSWAAAIPSFGGRKRAASEAHAVPPPATKRRGGAAGRGVAGVKDGEFDAERHVCALSVDELGSLDTLAKHAYSEFETQVINAPVSRMRASERSFTDKPPSLPPSLPPFAWKAIDTITRACPQGWGFQRKRGKANHLQRIGWQPG